MPNIKINGTTYNGVSIIAIPEAEGNMYAFYNYNTSAPLTDDLPEGYTAIPYLIASSGTIVDFGVVIPVDAWFKLKFKITDYGTIISNQSYDGISLRFYNKSTVNGYNSGRQFSSEVESAFPTDQIMEVTAFKDDKVVIGDIEVSAPSGGKSEPTKTLIFSETNFGGVMYEFKIYNAENVLIHNYVPAINSNDVVGFYDTKTATFHASTGDPFTYS